jgi:hypothetical protein
MWSIALGLAVLAGLGLTVKPEAAYGRDPEARRQRLRAAPGTRVKWIYFPPQKECSNDDWGPFLTDIDSHLPGRYGDKFSSDDLITHAHETTHGINSHITDFLNHTGKKAYGFYVGDDKAVVLVEPKVRLSDVAALIPESVRGSRYQLYLHDQQQYFEEHPLYVFDEWTAYINGARAGIEQARRCTGWDSRNDAMIGALELGIYSLGLALAVEKYDPGYLDRNPQFLEFLAHELRRAVAVYNQGIIMEPFRWERTLEVNLLESDDTRTLRETLRHLYGSHLTLEALLAAPRGVEPAEGLVLAPADPPAGKDKVTTGTIEGTVRDEADRAQPELEVRLSDAADKTVAKVKTDAKGKFLFKDVPPGKYKVEAKKFSGAKGEKTVEVEAGKKAKGDFVVKR